MLCYHLAMEILHLHAKPMTSDAMAHPLPAPADHNRQMFITFMACAVLFLLMQTAYATATPMGDVLCSIVGMVYGNLGRGLATLAVVIIGVGATLGKTSWGLAMTVAVGIAVIFNAEYVVDLLLRGSGVAFIYCP